MASPISLTEIFKTLKFIYNTVDEMSRLPEQVEHDRAIFNSLVNIMKLLGDCLEKYVLTDSQILAWHNNVKACQMRVTKIAEGLKRQSEVSFLRWQLSEKKTFRACMEELQKDVKRLDKMNSLYVFDPV
ncbi:hypothetical protein GLAREA_10904 [Glarea lozoyensis ATCC 20868]|uniref:Uncharacterized protein n=2 Tax=Glarea lozoyensis TaxID=101852 RepID=S3D9R1_GLAL2|nr:uncharacterized protein GLAREA_10904 [Glarea lozoyensis ATCC 20868]EHK96039.1 hypothetical protein M7I_8283 [Glarea lozoyensis 74030]EPE35207.1 hypothetical protein GLAREA_10904 [Glarea lozoyensis ATCC 20868]